MEIDEKILPILNKIGFANRYLSVCESYPYFENGVVQSYNHNNILETIKSYNDKFRYIKKEKFFKLTEKVSGFSIQFNIIIKDEVIQLVCDLKQDDIRLNMAWGTWESIVSVLMKKDFKIKPRPCFHNHDELKEILKVIFEIYADLKKEVINMLGE